MATAEEIIAAINKVEHPEIALPLVDLGMVQDVKVENDGVTLTLVVPSVGIPEAVRNYMVSSLYQAVVAQGSTLKRVYLAEMDAEEREAFFQKERAYWRD